MRAFAVLSSGETPAVHDLSIPDADGAFLIRVSYAGVNPLDSNLLERLTATSTYPFVMGIDFAGVIERGAGRSNANSAGWRACLRHGKDTRCVRRVHGRRPRREDRSPWLVFPMASPTNMRPRCQSRQPRRSRTLEVLDDHRRTSVWL